MHCVWIFSGTILKRGKFKKMKKMLPMDEIYKVGEKVEKKVG